MGLAYSNLPIVQATISASLSTFLGELNTLLVSAGWMSTPYNNGYEYSILSPQGLGGKCRIWYPNAVGYANCFVLQAISPTTGDLGLLHYFESRRAQAFAWDTEWFDNYRVWANSCSLFIGEPGRTKTRFYPRSVSFGVPYAYGAIAPAICEGQTIPSGEVTSELWWSGGTDSGVAGFSRDTALDFRSSYLCQRSSFGYNGSIANTTQLTSEHPDCLQLAILRPSAAPNFLGPYWADGLRFIDEDPLALNPLLCHAGLIYGELYDACLLSAPMELEATEEIYESTSVPPRTTSWTNYSRGEGVYVSSFTVRAEGKLYALLLLTGSSGQEIVNVAY